MLVIKRDVSYEEIAKAFVKWNDMSPLEICLHCAGYVEVALGGRAGKEQRKREGGRRQKGPSRRSPDKT